MTENNCMTELLTSAQMRAIEQAAIDSGKTTGLELMERAGRGVVDAIFEEWPALVRSRRFFGLLRGKPQKAVVFCGPGNNGGDGFVVARLLSDHGWDVVVFLYGEPDDLPPDAKRNFQRWAKDHEVLPFTDSKSRDPLLAEHPDLWIDAIFGIGLNRPLPDLVTQMMHRVYYEQNWCAAPLVAVDIVSGLSSDTGESVQTFHFTADLTVTFHSRKPGHAQGDGPMRSGKVIVKDIGLRPTVH